MCAGATTINLAVGRQQWITVSTVGLTHDLDPTCSTTTAPDLFLTFTLSQRELVYADTFGENATTTMYPAPTWDTILFFASSCTTAMPATGSQGSINCNDDATGNGCASGERRSQVAAVLDPGTYYLVLSGYAGASGTAPINFQHLPVGNGTAVGVGTMGVGSAYTYTGTTSGTGSVAPSSSACVAANGPEVTYWWKQCFGASRFVLGASTCAAATTYDSVLYYRNTQSTSDTCNDDLGSGTCSVNGNASSISVVVPGGVAGINAVTVDGYASSSAGPYQLTMSGAAYITSLDPARGVCRDPRRAAPAPRLRASTEAYRPHG